MRDETTIRRDAEMWALVAEIEALRCDRAGMEADNRLSLDGCAQWGRESFNEVAVELQRTAEKLRGL